MMRAIRKCLTARVSALIGQLERLGLQEYMTYLQNRPRMMWMNFLAGMARGLGFAVGFSILCALLVKLLQRLALENLPVIGEFLAEVIRNVQKKLPNGG
ncbi:MAG: DUF5665 domain-containing protein [Clostridia bacterium]